MKPLAMLALLALACAPSPPTRPPKAEPDTAYVLIRPRDIAPTPLHLAVRAMLRQCAGPERSERPLLVALADSIIGLPSGQLAYGISGPADSIAVLVLEAAYVHNAAVVSHELLHVAFGAGETSRLMRHCTLYVGSDLPERRVADPWWYVDRGQVLRVHWR